MRRRLLLVLAALIAAVLVLPMLASADPTRQPEMGGRSMAAKSNSAQARQLPSSWAEQSHKPLTKLKPGERFPIGGLIHTTFGGEADPFFVPENGPWNYNFQVRGLASEENTGGRVACQLLRANGKKTGLCLTVTGTTKSNSASSAMAIRLNPQFRFVRERLFAVVGIAGIESSDGTLGTVGIAKYTADADLGTHFVDAKQAPPFGWLTFDEGLNPYPQAAFRFNERLRDEAVRIGQTVTLLNDDSKNAASTERRFYGPAEAAEKPQVQACDTFSSDGFWVGQDWANKGDFIIQTRVREKFDPSYVPKCTTSQFEDAGIGGALRRFNEMQNGVNVNDQSDRTIIIRSGSDFENERPGTSPRALYDLLHTPQGFAGYTVSTINGARVGYKVMRTMVLRRL